MPMSYTQANSKGGIGKTTTTIQIAYEKALQGKKVLIIDGDSQRSTTKNLGLEPKPGHSTILAILTEPAQGIARAIMHYTGTPQFPLTFPKGGCIDLIPGARDISRAPATFDKTRERQPISSFEQVLPYLIREHCQTYDYVLLDPSPSQDRVNAALLFAADFIIAPVAAEPMALDGVQELLLSLQESNAARAGLHLSGQTELKGLLIAKVYPDQHDILMQMQHALDASGIPHFGHTYIP